MSRGGLEAGAVEQLLDADARPARVPDGAVFPLHARHDRLVETAAVARALEHAGRARARHLLQVGERQAHRTLDLAVHRQGPAPGILIRRVPVMAHEEEVVGRDVGRQRVERRLRVRRVAVDLEHPPLRIRDRGGWQSQRRRRQERRRPGKREKSPAVESQQRFQRRPHPIHCLDKILPRSRRSAPCHREKESALSFLERTEQILRFAQDDRGKSWLPPDTWHLAPDTCIFPDTSNLTPSLN